MVLEVVRRMDADASELLVGVDSARLADLRLSFGRVRSIRTKLEAFGAQAARLIAAVERHGDSGAGVLVEEAGVSRREAHRHTETAKRLQEMPRLRDAVKSGHVSFRNAERLAEAASTTSSNTVDSDTELLSKAATLTEDEFARAARRWSRDHQSDQGEAQHAKLRRRRSLRFFDDDDGMKHLRACLDPVTGARITNRIRHIVKDLYDSDKQNALNGDAHQRRTFDQCMADALEVLTAGSASGDSNSCKYIAFWAC